MIPFIRKYQPVNLSEIAGQESAIEKIRKLAPALKCSKKKAILLYGPPGAGKTTTIHAYTKEKDLEIVEVNASDLRNKDQLELTLGSAIGQQSLFSKGKVILIDEVDGIAGREDRGGLSAIASMIDRSTYPIFLTANDPFDRKFSGLRKKSNMIEFAALDSKSVASILKKICDKENITHDESAITALARRSGGDARAAINDLQGAILRSKEITKDSIEMPGERNKLESMPSALVRIFKTLQIDVARKAFDDVSENIDELFLWMEYNTAREYTKPSDRARAYEFIAKADVFRGRIRRRQHWRFITYIRDFLSAGVAISKDEKYREFVKYMPTMRLLRIWQLNNKMRKRNNLAKAIAPDLHTSSKRIVQDALPFFKAASQKNKTFAKEFSEFFELDSDLSEWLSAKA